MNEEKVSKFIKERREQLGLTQNDLAEKIHVSNKTISKWENKRGLMDITMLKPLSSALDVSITELINGELSSYNDFKIKTDNAFNITFQYMDHKVKKIKLRTVLTTLLIPIILLLTLSITHKIYLLNKYNVKIDNMIVSKINKKENHIKTANNNGYKLSEMIRYGEVAFVNNYKDYELLKPDGNYKIETYKYVKKDENNNIVSMFWFSDKNNFSYIDLLNNITKEENKNSDNQDDYVLTKKDVKKFLIDKNINDDVDLIKYLRNNYYFKSSIFTSTKNIKERYSLNMFSATIPQLYNDITYITGKHKGYIIDYDKNNSFNKMKVRELYLIVNNKVYTFTFYGDEFTTDKYIKNFIETSIIDPLVYHKELIDQVTN